MKGGANMEVNHDMSDPELKALLIDKYTDAVCNRTGSR